MRKVFKVSVSFIISFAITHFLDEIIDNVENDENNNKIMDNYPLNYTFIARMFNGIQGFIILWGMPEEKYLKNLLP